MFKNNLIQWYKCYKSYWLNLSLFIMSLTSSAFIFNNIINNAYGFNFTLLQLLCIAILLIITTVQFKLYKEKDRYITVLHVRKFLEKDKFDQR